MAGRTSDTTPYWSSSASFPTFAELAADTEADVLVVGGGITGLTAAYLLAKAGKDVVLLDRDRCASIDTGHTTAHLTMVTDVGLTDLDKRFGASHAQAVWDAGVAAIATIEDIVRNEGIDAGFARVDGYLHAPFDEVARGHRQQLEAEARRAEELGFDAEFVESVPLVNRPGVRFPGQGRFHPRRYLAGLARALVDAGGRIHEHSEAQDFSDETHTVQANGHTVRCGTAVIATHNPAMGFRGATGSTLFQTKLALYSSYVVAGTVDRGSVPDALWWDTADPYRFLRVDPGPAEDVVIFGGADHKTGQEEDTESRYRRLEDDLRAVIPAVRLTHRWSGQVIETADGLPYIGQSADRQYSATGYAGNGMTFGTLAGLMIADAILGRSNPWAELFDPGRKALTRGLWDYVRENADYPYYLVRDRLVGAEARSLRAVERGQGKIIERGGKKVAAYRDAAGAMTLRSAICTHMGCVVDWNAAEQTWDCPCHGSRFKPTGEVMAGPAQSPLSEAE